MSSESSGAKYDWVAGVLRSEIEDGNYGVGEALPSVAELVERFGISHMTAKQALGVLRSEGLIATGRGARARVIARQEPASIDDRLAAMSDRIAAVESRVAALEGHAVKATAKDDRRP